MHKIFEVFHVMSGTVKIVAFFSDVLHILDVSLYLK